VPTTCRRTSEFSGVSRFPPFDLRPPSFDLRLPRCDVDGERGAAPIGSRRRWRFLLRRLRRRSRCRLSREALGSAVAEGRSGHQTVLRPRGRISLRGVGLLNHMPKGPCTASRSQNAAAVNLRCNGSVGSLITLHRQAVSRETQGSDLYLRQSGSRPGRRSVVTRMSKAGFVLRRLSWMLAWSRMFERGATAPAAGQGRLSQRRGVDSAGRAGARGTRALGARGRSGHAGAGGRRAGGTRCSGHAALEARRAGGTQRWERGADGDQVRCQPGGGLRRRWRP
jgi:hypothetical protein